MKRYSKFHIHGDNIVECERAFELIKTSLSDIIEKADGPIGAPVCPHFVIYLRRSEIPLEFTFIPGFGRWNEDVLELIRDRGGPLREAADVIITAVLPGAETPLVAIEYCGALPAGNQAWQRSGRAYSFGLAGIPYLYVAELGGYELDQERGRKSPRMPNPAVPFSYLVFSAEHGTHAYPVFVTSPGADAQSRIDHATEFAETELTALMRAIMLSEKADDTFRTLQQKVMALVKKRAGSSRRKSTLTAEQWQASKDALSEGQSLLDYLVANARLKWSKTAYIESLTPTAKALMEISSEYAVGLTSTELPMCIIPNDVRVAFAKKVTALYSNLPSDFVTWLSQERHLAICWVMGFKPAGDDARPDRGLAPLTRMLVGKKTDLLTVVYGPAPAATWPLLNERPDELARRNGLWEAILASSDALLVDASTDNITKHGFLRRQFWRDLTPTKEKLITVDPKPLRIGENDVDTVLHLIMTRFCGTDAYEGLCNPPGGDWSGISLQSPDRARDYRWLSLPRVSGPNTKRPDHVFQLFGLAAKPIVLAVESKETAGKVEDVIGPRLSKYVSNLLATSPSVERENGQSVWNHSESVLAPESFTYASAIAFVGEPESVSAHLKARTECDLIFSMSFLENGESCKVTITAVTNIGRAIANYIQAIDAAAIRTSIQVQ